MSTTVRPRRAEKKEVRYRKDNGIEVPPEMEVPIVDREKAWKEWKDAEDRRATQGQGNVIEEDVDVLVEVNPPEDTLPQPVERNGTPEQDFMSFPSSPPQIAKPYRSDPKDPPTGSEDSSSDDSKSDSDMVW